MSEKYVVLNSGVGDKRGPCSFNVYKNIEKIDGMTVQNYKRILRSAAINVNIPNACSKDLVKVTGLSIQELKDQPELTKLIGQRIIQVLEDSSKVVEEKLIEVPLTDVNPDDLVGEGMIEMDVIAGEEPAEVAEPIIEDESIEEPVEEAEEPQPTEEEPVEEETQVVKKHRGRPAKNKTNAA